MKRVKGEMKDMDKTDILVEKAKEACKNVEMAHRIARWCIEDCVKLCEESNADIGEVWETIKYAVGKAEEETN